MDIVALQETRLLSSGYIREDGYTFFWQGKRPMEKGSMEWGLTSEIHYSAPSCQLAMALQEY